ncbi:PAS domain-containing sensor histidine kinase, partial [Nocardioides kribbensis]|uniref:PAS domain-containing sensor histidine kinase n=1 Tax=Nocardioides kribbensis TaxID=305517 RepID=UPI0032D9FA12
MRADDEGWRLFRWAAAAAGTVLVVATALMLGPWSGPDRAWIAADAATMAADLFAVAAVALRVRRSRPGPARRAWGLVLVALVDYAVADGVWTVYDIASAPVPYPSVADLFYLLAAPPALAGLLLFPVGRGVAVSRARVLLDSAVVCCAVVLVAFMVLLRDVFSSLGSGLGAAVNAGYPVLDVLLVCVASLLLLRGGAARPRADLALLGLGFICYAVADSAFALVTLDGSYESMLLTDVPYIAAPLVLGLAALAPPPEQPGTPSARARLLSAAAPDLAVLAALATTLAVGGSEGASGRLVLLVVVLAVVRQVWLGWENHRLRVGLEQRVAERTEENLALTARHVHLLESVGEGILGVDAHGRIDFVNDAGARMLGSTTAALVGAPACPRLHGVHTAAEHPGAAAETADPGPVVEEPLCALDAALGGRAVRDAEHGFRRSDGSVLPVEITADGARPGPDGRARGAVVVFRDATERRAADRLKSEFISVVSHELRTPLTSIHGALHLLHDGDVGELSPAAERVVDVALRGTDRLARLINDILVVDRLESGRLPLDLADHDAAPLVAGVLAALEPVADAAGIGLEAGPVEARVRVDADRFTQVLTNLVGNAVKFTPRGGLVRVEAVVRDGAAEVSVTDTGPGIPREAQETVFERFRQLDESDVRQRDGSGLGLAISRSLVEHQGGRIWVDSEPGHGASFRFTVPLAASA